MVRAAWRAHRRPWRNEVPTADLPEHAANDAYAGIESTTVLAALRRLPAKQRVVLVLRYWDDQSEEQIAASLGIAPARSRAGLPARSARYATTPLCWAAT